MSADSKLPPAFPLQATDYSFYDSPLRPCAEDIALMRRNFSQWLAARNGSAAPVRGLLLGVTPAIAERRWCDGFTLTALDHSAAMIKSVWPGDNDWRQAVCGDWFEPPAAVAGCDVIFADGIFNLLAFPAAYRALSESLRRVIDERGLFLCRAFCRPAIAESPEQVLNDARAGRIAGFHAFKWRLAMALQGHDAKAGIAVRRIWDAYRAAFESHEACADACGWPLAQVATIDAYRDSSAVYSFTRADALIDALSPQFDCIDRGHGSYELAGRCPVLAFTPRPA